MTQQYSLFLTGGGLEEWGTLVQHQGMDDLCRLTFSYRGKSIDAESTDYFEAFCDIRRALEPEGLIPFCYGASLNVYPAGMARGMVRGLKAYKLSKRRQARPEDLVYIFDRGPDVIPASVDLQNAFFRDWLESVQG